MTRPLPAPGAAGLLTLGESMGLISTRTIGTLDIARDATIGIGGAESNVAIGAARLGTPVTWLGRVGADAMGDLIVRRLRSEAIEVRATVDDAFTGLMIRHSRSSGSSSVDYHRRGSAGSRLTRDDIPAELIASAAVLHVTGITPALSESAGAAVTHAIDIAIEKRTTVSLDVNYRRKLWAPDAARATLLPLLRRCDIVFASADEARLILDTGLDDPDTLAAGITRLGPTEVVIKQGSAGCTALIHGDPYRQPAIPVIEVDPVGAGDAFVAGYLSEHLLGAPPQERLATAVAVGAFAVSVPGDCELLPNRYELSRMVQHADIIR